MDTLLQGFFAASYRFSHLALQTEADLSVLLVAAREVVSVAQPLRGDGLPFGSTPEAMARLQGLLEGNDQGSRGAIAREVNVLEQQVRLFVAERLVRPDRSDASELSDILVPRTPLLDGFHLNETGLPSELIGGARSFEELQQYLDLYGRANFNLREELAKRGVAFLGGLPPVVADRVRILSQRILRIVQPEVYGVFDVGVLGERIILGEPDLAALWVFETKMKMAVPNRDLAGVLSVFEKFYGRVQTAKDHVAVAQTLRDTPGLVIVGEVGGYLIPKHELIAALESGGEIPDNILAGFHPLLNPRFRERLVVAAADLARAREVHEAAQREVEHLTAQVEALEQRPTRGDLDDARNDFETARLELEQVRARLAEERAKVAGAQLEMAWQDVTVGRLQKLSKSLQGPIDTLLTALMAAQQQIIDLGAEHNKAQNTIRLLREELEIVHQLVLELEDGFTERSTSEAFDELEQRLLREQARVATLTERLRTLAHTADQRVASRTGELMTTRTTVDLLGGQLGLARALLTDARGEVQRLQGIEGDHELTRVRLEALAGRNEALLVRLEETDRLLREAEDRIRHLGLERAESQDVQGQQGEELATLRVLVADLEGALTERPSEEAVEESERRLLRLQSLFEGLQKFARQLAHRADEVKGALDQARAELGAKTTALEEAQGQHRDALAAVELAKADLERELGEARRGVETLDRQLRQAEEDLATARARVDTLEGWVRTLNERPETVEYARVVAALDEALAAKGKLDEQFATLTRTEQELSAEVARIADDLRKAQEAEASARAELARVSEAHGAAQREVVALTARVAELERRPAQGDLDAVRAELGAKTTALGESQAAVARLEKAMEGARGVLEAKAGELAKAEAALVTARGQVNALESAKAELQQEHAAELAAAGRAQRALEGERDSLARQVESLTTEVGTLGDRLATARRVLARLNDEAARRVPALSVPEPGAPEPRKTTEPTPPSGPTRRSTPVQGSAAAATPPAPTGTIDPRVELSEDLKPLLRVVALTGEGDNASMTVVLQEGVVGILRLHSELLGTRKGRQLNIPALRGASFEVVTGAQTLHVMVRQPRDQPGVPLAGAPFRLETYTPREAGAGGAADGVPAIEYTVAFGPFETYFSVTNPTPARDGSRSAEGETFATIHGGNHNPGVWAAIEWKGQGVGKVAGKKCASNQHIRFRQGTPVETPEGHLFITFFSERMGVVGFLSAEDVVYGKDLKKAQILFRSGNAQQDAVPVPARFNSLVDMSNLGLTRVGDTWQLTYVLRNGVRLELSPGKKAEPTKPGSSITKVVLSHGNPLTFHHGGQAYPYTFKVLDGGKLVVIDMSPLP